MLSRKSPAAPTHPHRSRRRAQVTPCGKSRPHRPPGAIVSCRHSLKPHGRARSESPRPFPLPRFVVPALVGWHAPFAVSPIRPLAVPIPRAPSAFSVKVEGGIAPWHLGARHLPPATLPSAFRGERGARFEVRSKSPFWELLGATGTKSHLNRLSKKGSLFPGNARFQPPLPLTLGTRNPEPGAIRHGERGPLACRARRLAGHFHHPLSSPLVICSLVQPPVERWALEVDPIIAAEFLLRLGVFPV